MYYKLGEPFHTIDINNNEEILRWLKERYFSRLESRWDMKRVYEQTVSLAMYLNCIEDTSQRSFTINSDDSPVLVYGKKKYRKLINSRLCAIINVWTSNLLRRRANYVVYPKNYADPKQRSGAETINHILKAKAQTREDEYLTKMALDHKFIFGESYVEVFWNPNKGPYVREIAEAVDEYGHESLGLRKGETLRMGDEDSRIYDPRNVLVEPANSYEESRWVDLLDIVQVDDLRAKYPKLAEEIMPSRDMYMYCFQGLDPVDYDDACVVHKFYHRATPEMPEGCYIEATNEVVLKKGPLPCNNWIKNQYFPVLQLADKQIQGSSRGYAGSVMERLKYLAACLNRVWLTAIDNVARFTPKYTYESGSLDPNKVRVTEASVIPFKRGSKEPNMLAQEVVSQGHMLLIGKLTDEMMQTANISPISLGDTIPNLESRRMQDFSKQQELSQALPADLSWSKFLEDLAKVRVALISEKYQDDEERQVQYFGKLKARQTASLNIKDLQTDVDICIETANPDSDSFEGRLGKIQGVLQIAPDLVTRTEIIEALELTSSDKIYDSVTASTDTAIENLSRLLQGKEVKSPQKFDDLITYYDVFLKGIRRKDVRVLIPDIYEPGGQDIGNKILDHIATIERLLWEEVNEETINTLDPATGQTLVQYKGDMPTNLPEYGAAGMSLKQFMIGKFPNFPAVYVPESTETVNPIEIQQQAMMQAQQQAMLGGIPTQPTAEQAPQEPSSP